MSDKELKPCPFCGGEASKVWTMDTEWVECLNCGAQTSVIDLNTGSEELWNTRPEPAKHGELVDMLDKAFALGNDYQAALFYESDKELKIALDGFNEIKQAIQAIKTLQAENERLREALTGLLNMSDYCTAEEGERIRNKARAALKGESDEQD